MTTSELILQKLEEIAKDIATTKEDIKTIKEDVKDIKKEKLVELKVTDTALLTNVAWIKVLFGIASSIVILLLGILINLAFRIITKI